MRDDHIRYYWLGFIVAAVGVGWLIWFWGKQREVTPEPLYISGRTAAYPGPASVETDELMKPDDLESIQGIGPAYARRLNDSGVTTFAQLAEADPDYLGEITGVTRWDPNDWISEARSLIDNG
ncbi:MAG TPA: helix-hairpin-helix domain-containing protein [candidate division Zixibacteria bacterium]|nr:helix-hairpin-helix domain-containing protein [candidate division Zixibacteria bacterium]